VETLARSHRPHDNIQVRQGDDHDGAAHDDESRTDQALQQGAFHECEVSKNRRRHASYGYTSPGEESVPTSTMRATRRKTLTPAPGGASLTGTKQDRDTPATAREKRLMSRVVEPLGRRRCTRCRDSLPLSEFRPNLRLKSGWHSWCRACCAERTRQWRAEHPELRLSRPRLAPARQCVECGTEFEGYAAVVVWRSSLDADVPTPADDLAAAPLEVGVLYTDINGGQETYSSFCLLWEEQTDQAAGRKFGTWHIEHVTVFAGRSSRIIVVLQGTH
jgi:hypothetical protein